MTNQVIPEAAVEAAARAIDASKAEGCGCCAYPEFTTEDDNRADELGINVRALLIAKEALEAAAPYMLAGGTGDREEVEERIKSIVQEVAMTVDYTERLYAAVQEIMAVTMPRPTP